MKKSLTISAAAHAAVFLWGIVSFSSAKVIESAEAVPVDVISDAQFSQMTQGSKTAPKAQKAPKPVVDKVAEPKEVKEEAAKVADKPEIKTASAEPPPKAVEPPKPDVKPPEAKPPPPQPEAKVEPQVDPMVEALKAEQKKKDEAKKVEDQKRKDEAKKREEQKKREEAKKREEQQKFDPNQIAALLDKRAPQRQTMTGAELNQTASLGTTAGRAAALTQSEIDALRAQIQACWTPPAGVADARDLIVTVRLQLKQDGSLQVDPSVINRSSAPLFQIASESALRAIRRCQPFRLPAAKYEVWRDVEVNFDPRDMFKG